MFTMFTINPTETTGSPPRGDGSGVERSDFRDLNGPGCYKLRCRFDSYSYTQQYQLINPVNAAFDETRLIQVARVM